jgi:hypothetical protein
MAVELARCLYLHLPMQQYSEANGLSSASLSTIPRTEVRRSFGSRKFDWLLNLTEVPLVAQPKLEKLVYEAVWGRLLYIYRFAGDNSGILGILYRT